MAGGRKSGKSRKNKGGGRNAEQPPAENIFVDENSVDGVGDGAEGAEGEWVPSAASKDAERGEEEAPTDEFGAKDYRGQMELRPDHECR